MSNNISELVPLIEDALIDLFEVYKEDIKAVSEDINGISFDLIPSTYCEYSAISFRQESDYLTMDPYNHDEAMELSPADWDLYSMLEYRTCKSEKFKNVSKQIFEMFSSIYEANDREDYNGIQQDINFLLLSAAAKALLSPMVTKKLRECGLDTAPVVKSSLSRATYYRVTDQDLGNHFNFCEFITARKKTKSVTKKLNL